MLELVMILAQTGVQGAAPHANAGVWEGLSLALVPILLALFKAWTSANEAKAAKTSEEKSSAEARAKAEMAEAIILGIEAYKRTLPTKAARDAVSAPIKAETVARGIEQSLEPIVRRLTGTRPVVDANGTPKLVDGSGSPVKPPILGAFIIFALALLPSCVSAEAARASERLAATAQIIRDVAEGHDALSTQLNEEDRRAALDGFQMLAAEHQAYADDLVRAAGGSDAEVRRLAAAWYEKAAARRRARVDPESAPPSGRPR